MRKWAWYGWGLASVAMLISICAFWISIGVAFGPSAAAAPSLAARQSSVAFWLAIIFLVVAGACIATVLRTPTERSLRFAAAVLLAVGISGFVFLLTAVFAILVHGR